MDYSTVWRKGVDYSAVWREGVNYSTVWREGVNYSTVWRESVNYSTVWRAVLHAYVNIIMHDEHEVNSIDTCVDGERQDDVTSHGS